MLTTLYYFAQVILCSGIMMGYYWLVLRDKKFHQYNRFYLLFAAAVAWIIPLIKIQWEPHPTSRLPVYELFYMVAENNSRMDSNLHRNWFQWNWQTMLTGVYAVVSIILCFMLIIGMIRIARILRKHPINIIDNFFLIITNVQGTPFSFFKYIFWNEQIDLQSESGKQILQHEITHVQQKHSIDKLFVQLVLVAGWFNPFFWLIKGELSMIHEYIADKKSVEHGDTASLAAMLLTAAYPRHPFLLSNPFFFSPIKRRIAMLTNQTKPKYSYLRRLIILPVMAIVLVLFAFRSKESRVKQPISLQGVIENVYNELKPASSNAKSATGFRVMLLKKKYLVVLAPAHGGADAGAKAPDGTKESELALRYAKLIKELNNNDHIEFVLSRTDDKYMHVVEVTDFINNQNPDLAISIHANTSLSSLKDMNGSGVYLSKTGISFNESYTLANNIATNLKDATFNFNGIKTRNDGVYILKNTKCPIVETEIGYLSSTSDLKKLKDPTYQKALASAILQGVQDYLYRKENTLSAVRDTTVLTSDSVYVIPAGKEVKIIGNPMLVTPNYKPQVYGLSKFGSSIPFDVLCLYDGVVVDRKIIDDIDPNTIESITVLKDKESIAIYGEAGKNGVILIRSKQPRVIQGYKNEEKYTGTNKINDAIYALDGVIVDSFSMKQINPNDIDNVIILNSLKAIELFGAKGRNGVIDIKTKKYMLSRGFPLRSSSSNTVSKLPSARDLAIIDFFKKNEFSENGIQLAIRRGINGKETKIVIQRLSGSIESYDLAIPSEKESAEAKYGSMDKLLAALESQPVSIDITKGFPIQVKNMKVGQPITIYDAPDYGPNDLPAVVKEFYKRNLDVKSIFWSHNPLTFNMLMKNGSRESYDLTNASSKALAEKRYGTLPPIPLPPPPSQTPKSDIIVTNVPLEKGYSNFKGLPVKDYKVSKKEVEASLAAKPEIPASFPGGKAAWLKYLERNLNIDLPVKKGGPPGTYTVIVQFTVHEDGFLSNIKALNNPGYGTAEEAVRVITKGPKWEPAQQNGKKVASIVKQSITFVISEE